MSEPTHKEQYQSVIARYFEVQGIRQKLPDTSQNQKDFLASLSKDLHEEMNRLQVIVENESEESFIRKRQSLILNSRI